jgi:hypothetical protein
MGPVVQTDVSLSSRYSSEHLTGLGGRSIRGWGNCCYFLWRGTGQSKRDQTQSR